MRFSFLEAESITAAIEFKPRRHVHKRQTSDLQMHFLGDAMFWAACVQVVYACQAT